MKSLKEFVRRTLHCSYDDAQKFISDFRHCDAAEYGYNILQNHIDDFVDEEGHPDLDIDEMSDDDLANIAIAVEDEFMSDSSCVEDRVLKEMFPQYYK